MSLIIVVGPQASGKTYMVLKMTQKKPVIWIKGFEELSYRLDKKVKIVVYDEFVPTRVNLDVLEAILKQPWLNCKKDEFSEFIRVNTPTILLITQSLEDFPTTLLSQAKIIKHEKVNDLRTSVK